MHDIIILAHTFVMLVVVEGRVRRTQKREINLVNHSFSLLLFCLQLLSLSPCINADDELHKSVCDDSHVISNVSIKWKFHRWINAICIKKAYAFMSCRWWWSWCHEYLNNIDDCVLSARVNELFITLLYLLKAWH